MYKGATTLSVSGQKKSSSIAPLLVIGAVPPPLGGISVHIHRLLRVFAENNILCQVLDESLTPTNGVDNIRNMSPMRYLKMMYAAKVVHIHTTNRYVRLFHTLAARLMGRRVLHTVHNHDNRLLPKICLRFACMLGHYRIAVSDAVVNEIGMAAEVLPAYIKPGPDDEIIPDEVSAWLLEQHKAGYKVIAMNAFRPTKNRGLDTYGLDMMIDVFKQPEVREKFSAIVCVADLGQGRSYFEELKARLEAQNLENRFWLRVGPIEFPGVIKLSDLFVRPTIADGDAVSIREALEYGIPVIASDAAARPEGVTLFKSRDLDGFAKCIVAHQTSSDRLPTPDQDFAGRVSEICETLLRPT